MPLVREERLHGADDDESRRRHGKLTQNNEHDGGGCPAPEERDARATLKLRKRLPGLVELSLALFEAVPVNLPRVEGVSPLLSFELQDHSHTVGAVIPLRHAVTANGLAELGRSVAEEAGLKSPPPLVAAGPPLSLREVLDLRVFHINPLGTRSRGPRRHCGGQRERRPPAPSQPPPISRWRPSSGIPLN